MYRFCYDVIIQHGSKVTDHHIFAKLTKHWEEEYHKDMAALNVSDDNDHWH